MNYYSKKYNIIDTVILCYKKRIPNPSEVFTKKETFLELMYWCKECNRERLEYHPTQHNLSFKIDDIGNEVNKHMSDTRLKMLANANSGKNSLSYKLHSIDLTIRWLISRWGNIFVNFATNNKYKKFVDASNIGHCLHDNLGVHEDTLSILLREEEEKEFEIKMKAEIKKWHQDWKNRLKHEKIGGETSECGNTQMVLIF